MAGDSFRRLGDGEEKLEEVQAEVEAATKREHCRTLYRWQFTSITLGVAGWMAKPMLSLFSWDISWESNLWMVIYNISILGKWEIQHINKPTMWHMILLLPLDFSITYNLSIGGNDFWIANSSPLNSNISPRNLQVLKLVPSLYLNQLATSLALSTFIWLVVIPSCLTLKFHSCIPPFLQCEAPKIAKLVYNSDIYVLWYL